MKKKTIAVFIRNKSAAESIGSFIKGSKLFRPQYHSSAESLLEAAAGIDISAIIVEDPLIQLISGKVSDLPVLSLITGSREQGIENAIACKADLYVYRPFLEKDLICKLQTLIQNRESAEGMKQELHNLRVIIEIARLISSTLDPQELLFRMVSKIAEIMPVSRCSIIRTDWLNRNAHVVASFEVPNIQAIRLNLNKYPEVVEALQKKKPVFIRDTGTDPIMKPVRESLAPLGIRSILVMPIFFKEKIIGTLFLRTSRKHHAFSESEIKLLKTISDLSSNILYNAFLYTQVEDEKTRLEQLAITDFLTGIYNIRYFYHRLMEEFSRSERYSLPISCLMLDIDYFKRINDTYGHKTGDAVLKEFATLLKRYSRQSDVPARYGGEEFIVMLPHTSVDGAAAEAERLRLAIKQHKFKSLKSKDGITVSIGISTFPNNKIKTHDNLISAADDALYQAKNSGRDRYSVFS